MVSSDQLNFFQSYTNGKQSVIYLTNVDKIMVYFAANILPADISAYLDKVKKMLADR